MSIRQKSLIRSIVKTLLSYNPKLILLHGSLSITKDLSKSRDIDIVIVSNIFEGIIFFDRIKYVQRLLSGLVNLKIDVICLTPMEFEDCLKKKGVLYQSLTKGYTILYKSCKLYKKMIIDEIF